MNPNSEKTRSFLRELKPVGTYRGKITCLPDKYQTMFEIMPIRVMCLWLRNTEIANSRYRRKTTKRHWTESAPGYRCGISRDPRKHSSVKVGWIVFTECAHLWCNKKALHQHQYKDLKKIYLRNNSLNKIKSLFCIFLVGVSNSFKNKHFDYPHFSSNNYDTLLGYSF